MCTLQSHGTGPVLESLLPDTIIDRGTGGVDAYTRITRPNYQARPVLLVHCQEFNKIPPTSWAGVLASVRTDRTTDRPNRSGGLVRWVGLTPLPPDVCYLDVKTVVLCTIIHVKIDTVHSGSDANTYI